MKSKSATKPLSLAALVTAGALALTACGDGETADTGGDDDEARGEISIVAIPGWTDQTGMAYLYEYVLEENGYDVEVENLGDMAPAFTAVAQGDIDLFGSTWPERTHDVYWEEHQDSLEDLGVSMTKRSSSSQYLSTPTSNRSKICQSRQPNSIMRSWALSPVPA